MRASLLEFDSHLQAPLFTSQRTLSAVVHLRWHWFPASTDSNIRVTPNVPTRNGWFEKGSRNLMFFSLVDYGPVYRRHHMAYGKGLKWRPGKDREGKHIRHGEAFHNEGDDLPPRDSHWDGSIAKSIRCLASISKCNSFKRIWDFSKRSMKGISELPCRGLCYELRGHRQKFVRDMKAFVFSAIDVKLLRKKVKRPRPKTHGAPKPK